MVGPMKNGQYSDDAGVPQMHGSAVETMNHPGFSDRPQMRCDPQICNGMAIYICLKRERQKRCKAEQDCKGDKQQHDHLLFVYCVRMKSCISSKIALTKCVVKGIIYLYVYQSGGIICTA